MSFQVTVAQIQEYKNNVSLLLQAKGNKLPDCVTTDTYTGTGGKVVEQIGAVSAQKRTSRHADTPLISTPHDARWVYPDDYEWADLVDTEDKLRVGIELTGPYVRNGHLAMQRAKEDALLEAFFADAKTGEKGENTETFDIAKYQIAAGAEGLTVSKLILAKEKLMAAEVDLDEDPLYIGITSKQNTNLLNETKAISLDYNNKPVLVDGKITSFMGFNFKHVERIAKNGSTRLLPCWAKSGMHLGMWQDIDTDIGPRRDKGNSVQVYLKGTFGATRTEAGKVIQIACEEA